MQNNNSTSTILSKLYSYQEDIQPYLIEKNSLGTGLFGSVYQGKGIAIKQIKAIELNTGHQEKEILAQLTNADAKNVINLLGYTTHDDYFYLITELVLGYTLQGFIKELSENHTLSSFSLNIMIGIAIGLKHIHKLGIVHGDIKPDNILIDEKKQPKICDFGSAIKEGMPRINCALSWAAPEVISNQNITSKADIFSFGTVMACMEKQGFYNHPIGFFAKIRDGERLPISPDWQTADLIRDAWAQDPEQRPTAETLELKLAPPNNDCGQRVTKKASYS
ncbi:MAG: hypothetical protein EPO11_05230 [Gammaproteobacteria bacterium]|nr:MAG: hypothetical protein EPO11_05230 [Gammaproteobacteria bacterium]